MEKKKITKKAFKAGIKLASIIVGYIILLYFAIALIVSGLRYLGISESTNFVISLLIGLFITLFSMTFGLTYMEEKNNDRDN